MASRKTIPSGVIPDVSLIRKKSFSKFQELTPPPDNFRTIQPCHHIQSVLDSKARDTVFITYRQAVNISLAVSDSKVYTSKKDGTVVSLQKLRNKKTISLKCTDCSLNSFQNNFICLQCPHVGCFTNHRHAYAHYKSQQHLFGIDSHNGLLYCFLCGDYVNHPLLENIRQDIFNEQVGKDEGLNTSFNKGSSDEGEISEHYTNPSIKAVSGLKGFVNLGATCYMSSILQTLIHNPIIKYQVFNNDDHFFHCEKRMLVDQMDGVIDETNACMTCSVDNIFQSVYTSTSNEGFGITNLLTTAWFKNKSFAGYQEQDAHEFWQFLLDEFHSDYKIIAQNMNKHEPEDECRCITHVTFSGELQSSIRCLSCNEVTLTIDPMMDLSLEIKQKVKGTRLSLYDCLDTYTKEEKLDVKYTCQYCGEKSEATKSLKLKTIPPVLAIQLKRFEHNLLNDTASKIETPVETPLFLNMTKYTYEEQLSEDRIDENKVFELFALVCHIGSVHTGHYVVIVKNGNGQWFKFDDSIVSLVSQQEVARANAYLVFYMTHKI